MAAAIKSDKVRRKGSPFLSMAAICYLLKHLVNLREKSPGRIRFVQKNVLLYLIVSSAACCPRDDRSEKEFLHEGESS